MAVVNKTSEQISQNKREQKDSFICETDADCILVQGHCCPCTSGGHKIAIHKRQQESHEQKLKVKCQNISVCMTLYNCKNQKAVCKNSQCQIILLDENGQ